MMFPAKHIVEGLRREYPAGTRVELIEMNDPYRRLPKGLTGTVAGVDDTGTIHVDWDNGSRLGAVYGEDRIQKRREEDEGFTG